jgi:hypothetical protein
MNDLMQPAKPRVSHSRIVVVEQVYFQDANGGDPTSTDTRFSRAIHTDEQPYRRPAIKVGPEWTKVDTGWIERVGLLVVANNGTVPIAVGVGREHEDLSIPPNESMRVVPKCPIYVRCHAEVRCTVTAFPW